MDAIALSKTAELQIGECRDVEPLHLLLDELSDGLSLYWTTAGDIVRNSGVRVLKPPSDYFCLEKNFFSLLFLYSYHRAAIPRSRRVLYAAVNQCLRGMVTGCDNILDDEYKKTLETNLPEKGHRFRSVLDIMVSDRVLFALLVKQQQQHELTGEKVLSAAAASLQTLVKSGAQEASEEKGIEQFLKPDEILDTVHHFKTGILFQCPWDIPLTIEPIQKSSIAYLLEALYRIGIGCQIMDDMVDLASDLLKKRHNYVASLIHHSPNSAEREKLQSLINKAQTLTDYPQLLQEFPSVRRLAAKTALEYLESGLNDLFAENHRRLVAPSISFMANRIGADPYLTGVAK